MATAPSTIAALRHGTARLRTGVAVHYVEHGDPDSEPILFLHGWPDSWLSAGPLLPLLPPALRGLAVDQRGFGLSERPAGGYSIDGFAEDAVALLDALGIERAAIVGHSMGSLIARRAAELHPERVGALVLIGTALDPVNEVTREVLEIVRGLEDPISRDFARDFQASTLRVPIPDPYFQGLLDLSLRAPARVWRASFESIMAFDDRADIARIAAPTLLIWGDSDALFPTEVEVRNFAAALPEARVLVYPNAGHSPNWEYPERTAADIARFVAGA
jgi:non-heme chloroperoxidase